MASVCLSHFALPENQSTTSMFCQEDRNYVTDVIQPAKFAKAGHQTNVANATQEII